MNTFIDEKVYPVEYSAGGVNAFYVTGCDQAGHRPAYCICVNKMQAFDRGALKDSECESPLRYGNCIARKMRAEELSAGKAIYFIHRDRLKEHVEAKASSSVLVIAEATASRKKNPMIYPAYVQDQIDASRAEAATVESTIEPALKSSVIDKVDDTSYSAVITKALSAAPASAPVPAPMPEVIKEAEVTGVVPVSGESLLDMARRIKASKSN